MYVMVYRYSNIGVYGVPLGLGMERKRLENGDHCNFRHYKEVDHVSPEWIQSKSQISSSSLYSSSARASASPLPPSCLPAGVSVGVGVGGGVNYIEHRISKMDTLAGVAIKYGVEVADIKRINGLVTDLQMFALKTLHIPLPGRHPPSPNPSNGLDNQGPSHSEKTPPRRRHSDLFESFQALKPKSSERVSPAMSSLQGYYGLKPAGKKNASEGFEMAVYRKGSSHYLEDGPLLQSSTPSNPASSLQRKCRSVANGLFSENGELPNNVASTEIRDEDSEKWSEKLIRRRQKSEADFNSHTPELLMKEDNNSNSSGFSTKTGKGLALRPKLASRTSSGFDSDSEKINPIPIGMGDSLVVDSLVGVRKSSSTSSLQDQENSTSSSSIWSTSKWSLKPDLQALSAAAITRPIFDGLPKPITGRRNKAALD